jgi:uncharacterized protein (DUF58 family)
MLIPHQNLVIAAMLWLIGAIVALWLPAVLPVWQIGGVVLLALSLADAGLARRIGNPLSIERQMAQIWPVGMEQTVILRASCKLYGVSGELYDRHPDAFAVRTLPLSFNIKAGHWAELGYQILPNKRGEHLFGSVQVRIVSPFSLWLSQYEAGKAEAVRVFPNFARINQYALLATDNRLSQLGVLRRRRRGEGSDFDQLREYRPDDTLRHVDWKATARMHKPIVRNYQDERDQQIFFLLDCGQRMRSRDDDLSHFDHTLNAMLLLAYVALRQGDAAGFITFAHPNPRVFYPRKSTATVQMLLNATYDLQPTLLTPDYLVAGKMASLHLSKRSLVILLTNLRDEDDITLQPALTQLRRRHLVLVANLREAALDQLLLKSISDFDDALSYAAAVDYQQSRQRQLANLRAQGVHVLDVAPAQLPVALVNRYWQMKRSGTI